MKIWVLSTTRGQTAWTTKERAREELLRIQLEESREDLESLEESFELLTSWLLWFDGAGPRPVRGTWETYRLEQHPEWPARPEIMAELRLSISKRQQGDAERIVEARERIEKLERGITFDEWGFGIFEWTLDDPEPQAFESWD